MRIDFEDDVVKVEEEGSGKIVYKGLEDYEPMKREDWTYNREKGLYTLEENGVNYIKTKIGK